MVNTRLDTGVSFINQDGVTGLSAPPRDAAALSAALNRLLDSPALREKMGAAAQERLESVFSREAMVRTTLELYESL